MAMLAKIDGPLLASQQVELHSHEPWNIGRYVQQLEKTALHNLRREGFEAWMPTYKSVKQRPFREIPPKRRHQAHMFLKQTRVKRFPGYVLLRRVSGCFDINRLFDLTGCGGIVTVGGKPAMIKDFDIELMRLAETDGTFDVYEVRSMPIAYYKVDYLPGDDDLRKQIDSFAPLRRPLDDSMNLSLTVDAFGRVSRLIAQADAL